MLRFDKIGGNVDLNPEKSYEIPEAATHVGLRNGILAFFWSPNNQKTYKSGKKWFFMKIPDGVKFLAFPEARRTSAGWRYGIKSAYGYKRIDG